MDDYLIPTRESAEVFRDNDIVQVKEVHFKESSDSRNTPDTKKSRITVPCKKGETSGIPAVTKVELVSITKKLPSGGVHTNFFGIYFVFWE